MKKFIFMLSLNLILSLFLFAQENETKDPADEILTSDIALLEAKDDTETSADISTPTGDVKKSFGFEYFPLKQNVEYEYDSNAGDTESIVSEAGDELVLTYDAGKITYEQQFFKGDKGIYLTRTETRAFLLFCSKVTYPEPVLRLPLPLETGATWQWVGLEIAGGDTGKLTIDGEALGEEEVTTPVGKFTCLKIRMRIESEMGSKNTVTEWLAPNIGVIKFHADLEGSGITGFLQTLMGLDEITFDLKGIKEIKT